MLKNNQPPFWTPLDKAGGAISAIWQQWINALYLFVQGVVDYTTASVQTPTTGFTITPAPGVQVLTLNPAGTLATGTLNMPVSPADGQQLQVSTTHTIAALTVAPQEGQTISNAPTMLAAGTGFAYYFNQASQNWFRVY